jgi:hypothetical protein
LFLDDFQLAKSQEPNKTLNIPKLKSKHKRLFRKLVKLNENNFINSYSGNFLVLNLGNPIEFLLKNYRCLSDVEKYLKRKLPKDEDDSIERYLSAQSSRNDQKAGVGNVKQLEVKLVRSCPPSKEFEESLSAEHKLYTKYQTTIHNDSPLECNLNQFKRFLCTSPLIKMSYNGPLAKNGSNSEGLVDTSICGDIKSIGYGSFHQQYRLDGKLIAVGVIDILSTCVSSVYFFYDPDYQFLNFGTYSALR